MTDSSDVLPLLAELIAFPTVSSSSNLEIVEHIEAYVSQFGCTTRRFNDPVTDKANVLISIGPQESGGIVFSGHTDVVPVAGQPWTSDPWTMRLSNDRLVGRGVTDMKGFLACSMAALPQISRMNLQRPIHLAFSYDEEVGCTGVGPMAEWVGAHLKPKLAVIGEPTSMELIRAHKGGCIGWCNITGKSGHSSQPERGVNAVMVASRLVSEIGAIYSDMKNAARFEDFDPPWSTIQVNQIEGGTHGNILAEHCKFFWEMRLVPGESDAAVLERMRLFAKDLEREMHEVSAATSIEFDILARIPALAPMEDRVLEAELLTLLGSETTGAVSYGTEAGIFAAAGTPSVVIGPGSMRDAHQPDESIAIDQLTRCVEFLEKLAHTATMPKP